MLESTCLPLLRRATTGRTGELAITKTWRCSLNQRVPGSSPSASTIFQRLSCGWRMADLGSPLFPLGLRARPAAELVSPRLRRDRGPAPAVAAEVGPTSCVGKTIAISAEPFTTFIIPAALNHTFARPFEQDIGDDRGAHADFKDEPAFWPERAGSPRARHRQIGPDFVTPASPRVAGRLMSGRPRR